jgi:uncharacterized protein (DUF2147 family)
MAYPFYVYHLWQEFKTVRPVELKGYIGKERIHGRKVGEYFKEHPEIGAISENKTGNAYMGYCLRAFRKDGKAYELEPVSGRVIDLETGQTYECLRELIPPTERQERLVG